MDKKVLLLGHTGKIGTAINEILSPDYIVEGKNTKDFDAEDFGQVRNIICKHNPDILINTVALLGIEPCEETPERALRLNTLYPKFLAELSNERNFLLIHFSTDAVFNDEKGDFYTEKDIPKPLNLYGFTKYGGDCFIQAIAKNYYIFRISVVFGETAKNTQFVEKMLQKVKRGVSLLRISDDIILSPTYSKDIAREVKRILEDSLPPGLYHIVNEGKVSLYDLMEEIVNNLNLNIQVEKASYKDFPFKGRKNTFTPLRSEKIKSLRPWRQAVKEYCRSIKDKF